MNSVYSFLILLSAFILQTTILNSFGILGVTPNIILCLIVVFCFIINQPVNFTWAILFGLLHDAYFSEIFGISALCYFLIVLAIYTIKDLVNPENMISIIVIIIGSTFIYSLMYFGLNLIFGSSNSIIIMLEIQPILIIYNVGVGILLYRIFMRKMFKYRNDKKFKGRLISYE